MSSSSAALSVMFGIVAASAAVGFYAKAQRTMNLEQWTVAGRGFGLLFVWLLMAGEVYTTFSFLGASGWAYSRGGPTLYILAYLTLAYVVSFFILPQMWEMGRRHEMQTQSDFFHKRYGSTHLAAFVSLVGVVFIIPYLQLQLTGLGIIMEITSFGGIGRVPAMLIAFAIVAALVFVSGIRGVAWMSIVKDLLMLVAAVSIGISLPYIHFGGIGAMFRAVAKAHPDHLVMPGGTQTMGHSWYISTVLLTSLGFYMWPHFAGAAFTAKSADVLRRNSVIMPLYSVSMPLIFFVGFTALMVLPGLPNGDLALLTLVRKTYPPWFLGVIGGAGALTAMVPAAILILTAATLFAKNFYRPLVRPSMTDEQVQGLARILVIVVTLVSLYFAVYSSTTIVALLLLGYAGVAQFFPGIIFGLYWPRVTAKGVFPGIIAGIGLVAFLSLRGMDPFMGLNAGFLALCVNFVITVGVTCATGSQPPQQAQAKQALK
jgi:solute:Na+ symporter, SSS family